MRRAVVLALLLIVPSAWAGDFIVICPIDGMIDDGIAVLVERAVEEAKGAESIIFVIDTPGGRVDSCQKAVDAILHAPCRTIAYIKGMGAISAGSVISFSCKDLVIASGSNIGAAAPVIMSPQGPLPTGEKEVSYLQKWVASLCEVNGHNADIARAMVDKDVELHAYVDEQGKTVVYAVDVPSVREAEIASGAEVQARRLVETVYRTPD